MPKADRDSIRSRRSARKSPRLRLVVNRKPRVAESAHDLMKGEIHRLIDGLTDPEQDALSAVLKVQAQRRLWAWTSSKQGRWWRGPPRIDAALDPAFQECLRRIWDYLERSRVRAIFKVIPGGAVVDGAGCSGSPRYTA